MGVKEIVSYVSGIVTFGLVGLLLRRRMAEEFAFGIGLLAMLLVSFPVARYFFAKPLTFLGWVMFSTLGAVAGVVVFFALGRIL